MTMPRLALSCRHAVAVPGLHYLPTGWVQFDADLEVPLPLWVTNADQSTKRKSKLTHTKGGVANAAQSTKKIFNVGTAYKRGGSCQKLLAPSPPLSFPLPLSPPNKSHAVDLYHVMWCSREWLQEAFLPLFPFIHIDLSPKHLVVFCHGLLGFDSVTIGPAIAPLEVTHWQGIKEVLQANS